MCAWTQVLGGSRWASERNQASLNPTQPDQILLYADLTKPNQAWSKPNSIWKSKPHEQTPCGWIVASNQKAALQWCLWSVPPLLSVSLSLASGCLPSPQQPPFSLSPAEGERTLRFGDQNCVHTHDEYKDRLCIYSHLSSSPWPSLLHPPIAIFLWSQGPLPGLHWKPRFASPFDNPSWNSWTFNVNLPLFCHSCC